MGIFDSLSYIQLVHKFMNGWDSSHFGALKSHFPAFHATLQRIARHKVLSKSYYGGQWSWNMELYACLFYVSVFSDEAVGSSVIAVNSNAGVNVKHPPHTTGLWNLGLQNPPNVLPRTPGA